MTQLSDPANPSVSERTVFPLSGVTRAVGRMLDERAGGKLFWVRAEISQCSFSGKHAYIDLVEEEGGRVGGERHTSSSDPQGSAPRRTGMRSRARAG